MKPMHLNLKKGALRKALHVAANHLISKSKLAKASHSKDPLLKKRAILAENMAKWDHSK